MHLSSRSLPWLFVASLACGAPAELDQSLFPAPNDTGYTDGPRNAGGSSGAGQSSSGQGGRIGGTGGSGNASQGGSMQLGVGGAGMNLGGSSPGGSGTGGSAQTGMGGSAPGGNGGSGNPPDGCPDDVTELFRRPGTQGGCEGGSCHSPGSPIAPDLVSPNVLERLLDEPSTCQGRPYIGAGDSVIADKISDSPDCGSPMPLLTPQALSAADEQCILDWIEEVAAGG